MRVLTIIKCWQTVVIFQLIMGFYLASAARQRRVHKSGSGGHLSSNDDDIYGNSDVATRRRHSSNDVGSDADIDEFSPEELLSLSTNNEERISKRKPIDPKRSWVAFTNRLSEQSSDTKRRKKRKRNKKTNNKILLGPPGPAGPPGPQGPPGKGVSKEEILESVKLLIKEESEKRAQEIVKELKNTQCNSTLIAKSDMDVSEQYSTIPRIYAGFSMKLNAKSRVRRKTLMELKSFQQPFGEGAFQRGEMFNSREGRFHVPRDGIYQFTAILHLRMRTKRKLKGRSRRDEHLRLVICIDSLCQTNTSIETITAVSANNTIFSSNVHGILHLREKQYTSLYIDNSSSYTILVLPGTQFYGILMGV